MNFVTKYEIPLKYTGNINFYAMPKTHTLSFGLQYFCLKYRDRNQNKRIPVSETEIENGKKIDVFETESCFFRKVRERLPVNGKFAPVRKKSKSPRTFRLPVNIETGLVSLLRDSCLCYGTRVSNTGLLSVIRDFCL